MPALFAPPAIIHPLPLVRVRFGLQVSQEPSARIEYAELTMPRDFRDGKLAQWLPYIPSDLHHLPPWVLMSMLPGMAAAILASVSGTKTTTILTSTSVSDQTWTVLSDWNNADNSLNVISAGASGGNYPGPGGGGGGFARAVNQALTASGSSKYRLRARDAGTGTTNACWIGGSGTTSLATSLAGIQCAGGSTAGSTTSAVGSTKNGGGAGGSSAIDAACCCGPEAWGGGGGAAGPNGAGSAGGNAGFGSNGAGGAGDGGNTAGSSGAGHNGTQFTTAGSGGGGGGGDTGSGRSGDGGLYGGGGGAGFNAGSPGRGAQGLIVTINNASL